MIGLAAQIIFVITTIVTFIFVILGKSLLGIFGTEFVSGYLPLVVLLCGQTINALTGSVGFILVMTGHQKVASRIVGISAMANILLNALAIPKYGLLGAAAATAFAISAKNLSFLYYVIVKLKLNPTVFIRR
jgi:O-antigen/teichoic acid export membrane protein